MNDNIIKSKSKQSMNDIAKRANLFFFRVLAKEKKREEKKKKKITYFIFLFNFLICILLNNQ